MNSVPFSFSHVIVFEVKASTIAIYKKRDILESYTHTDREEKKKKSFMIEAQPDGLEEK